MSELEKYSENNYIVLNPTAAVEQISPLHRMSVSLVTVNTDEAAQEIYKVGSKQVKNGNRSEWVNLYGLSKVALMKVANAAGVRWNWTETKVVSASRDYVLYQAVGLIRNMAGEFIPLKATKEIDLTVIEDELHSANMALATRYANDLIHGDAKVKETARKVLGGSTPVEWAEGKTKTAMIQWRKTKVARAETGAMLRVVRALLTMKHQYTIEELKKPFAIPHVDFSPDFNDPEVKKMMLTQGAAGISQLYGSNVSSNPMNIREDLEIVSDAPDAEDVTIDATPVEEPNEDGFCTACGVEITESAVIGFSKRKFGKVLCRECQKK